MVHLQTHTEMMFSCGLCSEQFNDPKKIQDHSYAMHEIMVYPCDLCGISSKSPAGLHMHKRHMHKDVIQPPRDAANMAAVDLTNDGIYKCYICDEVFTSKSSNIRHRQSMHENRMYKCRCGAEFKWSPQYYKHRRTCSSFQK